MLLTGFSLGCLTVIFVIVARDFWQLAVAKAFLALLLAAAAFLVREHIDPAFRWLASDIMTMVPALFWLLCQLAFARRPNLVSLWSAIAVYSFVGPAITRFVGADSNPESVLYFWGWYVPRFCEYIVIFNGLWVIIANWQDDLIASRRQLRGVLLGSVGFTSLWVTISLNTGHGSNAAMPIIVSISSLLSGFLLLKGREGVLLGVKKQPIDHSEVKHPVADLDPDKKQKDELKKMVATIERVMDDEHFYRTEKLTLSMLAEKISLPEYKTRALINQTFNYRNFNDYVNQLRIEEASERLIQEPNTPIQNIALDVGYRTLSSFNRAFKEILDQTPTEFRLKKSQKLPPTNN